MFNYNDVICSRKAKQEDGQICTTFPVVATSATDSYSNKTAHNFSIWKLSMIVYLVTIYPYHLCHSLIISANLLPTLEASTHEQIQQPCPMWDAATSGPSNGFITTTYIQTGFTSISHWYTSMCYEV